MTHLDLLEKARYWLGTSQGCNPVFIERGSATLCERPDAIGWNSKDCLVVECKTSMDDFRADKKKACRQGPALGNKRYFLVPVELREKCMIELPYGWGLVVADENKVERVRFKDSGDHERDLKHEALFLRSRILEIQRFGK